MQMEHGSGERGGGGGGWTTSAAVIPVRVSLTKKGQAFIPDPALSVRVLNLSSQPCLRNILIQSQHIFFVIWNTIEVIRIFKMRSV
jgi:hypothetical protein